MIYTDRLFLDVYLHWHWRKADFSTRGSAALAKDTRTVAFCSCPQKLRKFVSEQGEKRSGYRARNHTNGGGISCTVAGHYFMDHVSAIASPTPQESHALSCSRSPGGHAIASGAKWVNRVFARLC